MIDLLLLSVLVTLAGIFLWMERGRFSSAVGGTGETTLLGGVADQSYFWRLARPAGLAPDQAWVYFVTAKVTLGLIGAALPILGGWRSFGVLLCALSAFMVPDLLLMYVRRARQRNIRRGLSFFLDMIVSLLQAGLTLEEAFRRAAKDGLPKESPLAEEASLIVEELDLGRDRTSGFQALGDRTGVRELKALAAAVSLGLGSGASVEATLRSQADLARAKRREAGLQYLNIASAEVLIPLLLCGFPVFIVMVFFPLALLISSNLQALAGALR